MGFQKTIELIQHQPGFYPDRSPGGIEISDLIEILGGVHHQRGTDRLTDLRGASSTRQHRNTGIFGDLQRAQNVLLVTRYQALMKQGSSVSEAVMQGSLERLAPILMTALTAGLALVPLVLAGREPGNEIQSPMAIVIIGGLLSSTFLNLIVVPVLFASRRSAES